MTDEEIVLLFTQKNEKAIREADRKYGAYLFKVAFNVLGSIEDSKEKVNDTYFRTWNIIPPNAPKRLLPFLAKITRSLAVDEYRKMHSLKRKATEYASALDEIGDFAVSYASPESEAEKKLLSDEISSFVASLPDEQRNIFVCRYFFFDSIKDISLYYGMSESKVKSILYRTRLKLKERLERGEFIDEK